MPLYRQPLERLQRPPSRATLDRRRAVAFQPLPACPLRLSVVLDPWGAVLRTALHRRPHHPQVLPSQAILDRSRAVAAMALQRPPASATTTLHGPRAARSMALQRTLACPLRLRALLHWCRLLAAMALQRPLLSPLRLWAVLGRWRAALQRPLLSPLRLRGVLGRWRALPPTARQRQPLGRRRPPSRPLLERWAAAAMAL